MVVLGVLEVEAEPAELGFVPDSQQLRDAQLFRATDEDLGELKRLLVC